ncbi:sulfate permease [Cupriavidus sp. SK-4]|uniref:SulP family inorganic anion transporter n=1 Tax=Cupriavidus sp. SK-4 TaxID=574750 RepID=UPI00044BF2D3|nr:SulP family inorganic anion transporter [Cupriavidus sp. SK-4]EYS86457.1 sulfate permease [Cupriavidus sp. SK-4]
MLRNTLTRLMPGAAELLRYHRKDFAVDLQAGVSVAAVSLPISVAYAQLAGFSPVVGLYSVVLPMLAYALFGSSRQLIVGPDAATCAMIAATLSPLALPDSEAYRALSVSLTLLTGVFCVLAGKFRLGFLADFLSVPILAGLLNGVAINIAFSQIGKVTGLTLAGRDVIGQAGSFLTQLGAIHWPTAALGALTLAVYFGARAWQPRAPGALFALAFATFVSWMLGLQGLGVQAVGPVPAGLPRLIAPSMPHELFGTLVPAAAALALVSLSSGMLTSRSFAARNGYTIDANQEFIGIGAASIASALSQGFAVSGSSSRTAINEAAGGRTRMVSVVGAVTVLLVLLFLTDLLAELPTAALGAILIASAFSLFDFGGLMALRRYSRVEHGIALVTVAGVVLLGVMSGILLAVAIALLRFLAQMARPGEQQLGLWQGHDGFYELAHYPEARPLPGLLIYRFESPLTFFNADFLRQRIVALTTLHEVRWVVIDAISIAHVDLTGATMMRDLQAQLSASGTQLVIAGRTAQLTAWLERRGVPTASTGILFYPSKQAALQAYMALDRDRPAPATNGQDPGPTAADSAP